MVRGLQEKQYQLAAQKRHEANLKYNYYKEAAKFFERGSENNKQFNSWQSNEISPCFLKSLKAEKLRQRQSQLKSIFQKEQEEYAKELLELKSKKPQARNYSIEDLNKKSEEAKPEPNLYLPKDCRRRQSYFYNSRSSDQPMFGKKRHSLEMSHTNTCPWECDSPSYSKGAITSESPKHHSQLLGSGVKQALLEDSEEKPRRSFVMSSRRSLEETNLVNCDKVDNSREIVTIHEEIVNNNEKLSNGNSESVSPKQNFSNGVEKRNSFYENSDKRKSLSWMREKTKRQQMSQEMVRYLVNKDFMERILDLSKKEFVACRKQSWHQALRFRDMKSKLELMKDKNMYNILVSYMDGKTQKSERRKIDERSAIVSGREEICENTCIYDEEAKVFWEQWVHEDDNAGKMEQREDLLSELDEQWKNLDEEDRRRAVDLYHNIMFKSEVLNVHDFSKAIKSLDFEILE